MNEKINSNLENTYKQFRMQNLPIFYEMQPISIQKLFKILTNITFNELHTIDAMNFYLYSQFFKNRLLYSVVFRENLTYLEIQVVMLKQRINNMINKYEQTLLDIKSESDSTWIANVINTLNDGLMAIDTVPNRCNYTQ